MDKEDILIKIIFAIPLIIFIIILIVVIYTYADYGTKEGTIIDKSYHQAYTTTEYTTSNINNSTIRIPQQIYHPETYNIKIQKQDGAKLKECWIQITALEYEKYKIGDYYEK